MCRFFAALSPIEEPVAFPLWSAPTSLLVQSRARESSLQKDGWGVGWYARSRRHVKKSGRPIWVDEKRLRASLSKWQGTAMVGHVRLASNPQRLSPDQLIGVEHSQPFAHGPWLFVHNGTLMIPVEVAEALGPWSKFISGRNDSEVLFYWLLKTVFSRKGNMKRLVRESVEGLEKIWAACRDKHPDLSGPFHGLNWSVTNGTDLVVFCFEGRGGFGSARAFTAPEQPYFQLQFHQHPQRLMVASEPLWPGRWKGMRNGSLLIARNTKTGVKSKIYKIL